jgi:hypothetical protein
MIEWLKSQLRRRLRGPEPRRRIWREVPHVYAKRGTLLDYQYGDMCLFCLAKDAERRVYTEVPCTARARRAEVSA